MEKRLVLVVISIMLGLFLISSVFAVSGVDSEIQKITHYAKEFETGNINYVKLLVYISESRQNLNEILGATEKEMGGILKQEKIREILGEPVEETKWVWVEGEEQDKKLDSPVPVWKKVIFDGKKIQIRLNTWPSIFSKKKFSEENVDKGKVSEDLEGKLIYRLNFEIEFKRPEEQLNIGGKIDEIKSLAEAFNSNPSQENAETLAKESVNAEKKFESYLRQSQGNCEDLMASIFGSENQMPIQNMIVQEISFYEGEKFEIIARLEMCDECEWNWINLDLWAETRGPMPKMDEGGEMISPEQFKNKDNEYYKSEITNLLDSYKKVAEEKNWKEANRIKQKLWIINEAWNQKANEVWKEVDEQFKIDNKKQERVIEEDKNQNKIVVENTEGKSDTDNKIVENIITGNLITGKVINEINNENKESQDPYYWIKQDQERRKKEKELRKQNYEERKQFYLNLFSGYDKKEYSFAQIEFKKRLIELFKEKGEEICNNNKDDNQNEKADCQDEQCGGKICGKGASSVIDGNETREIEVDFYCIAGDCKAKEQVVEIRKIVCGNHVCEENESVENCIEDCSACQTFPAVNCSGRVIFSGRDVSGCPLEPRCIEEKICNVNEDCGFLCGEGQCIEGKCEVKELGECREAECVAGDKKIINCQSGEQRVIEECVNGLWEKTGIECVSENVTEGVEGNCNDYCLTQPRIMCVGRDEISGVYPDCNCGWICEEEVVEDVCTTISDCGGENDVCSNGECITIPEVIQPEILRELEEEAVPTEIITEPTPEPEQIPAEQLLESEPAHEPSQEQSQPITGEIIKIIKSITGAIISGFQTEGEAGDGEEPAPEPSPEPQTQEPLREDRVDDGEISERQNEYEQDGDNRREEDERMSQEQKERCKKECNKPCIEKCIRENCGKNMDCNIDEESKKCEGECQPDDSCVEKCMKGGGEWWKEFESKEEFKEQAGGFEAGGNCRTAKGRTDGFIWFGGWGNPFEKIQPLKNKYYSGGNAEWCKFELENLIKQREEFEKGFNQEFAKWFFEDYLANSAENWEQAVSGIFELYWKNVDNQREIAFRMKCLDKNDINEITNYNLISIKYETNYGKIEYWEEIKSVKIPGMEGGTTIISPYMKIWIFPPKEFIKYEMKKAMKNHEFPGPPEEKMERKNEEGLTSEEKEMIKQDKKFMKIISTIAEKYGGSLDVVIQFKDLTNNEVIFNLYAQVNENEIIKMTPMLPEEVLSKDVTAEIDFEKIYELIYSQEKEMRGEMVESPPWDRKIQPIQKIKEVVNGAKMYFKVREIMNSAKITPAESEKDVKNLFKKFMSMMMKGEKEKGMIDSTDKEIGSEGEEKVVWEEKEKITGEITAE